MAAGAPVLDLLEEATCSICLAYFQDPVLIPECGHNFCRSCLTQSWGESESEASCPQCRGTFVPHNILENKQLARVLEAAQRRHRRGEEGGSFYGTHREPLKPFCKDHKTLICLVYDQSREHKDHQVIPLEEAFQEYQMKIGDFLKAQKEEKEKIITYKTDTEHEIWEMLDLIKKEREKTVAEFRELRCWLEEQEKFLLARMEETEKEIVARREEVLAKYVEKLSSLEELIQEMEEKQHQQPASEHLQDIASTLKKYQAKKPFENPVALLLELKWRIWDYSDMNVSLKGIMKKMRDTLKVGLHLQKANVILDPDTAYPWLEVSNDCKSVREGFEKQDLPENPERFEKWQYVLGCQGFSRGRHFWDVTVEDMGRWSEWSVGVAKKSVNRKDDIDRCPEEGIWEVGRLNGKYKANFPPEYPELPMTDNTRKIRVSLNCEGGQVTFFNAETAALLYTFSEAPWAGETLLPSFFLGDYACLTLSP